MGTAISRNDIAEIHESIAKHHPARSEVEQKHQQWHAYAAKIVRENDVNVRSTASNFIGRGNRQFTHFKHWTPVNP